MPSGAFALYRKSLTSIREAGDVKSTPMAWGVNATGHGGHYGREASGILAKVGP
jgi:hypothetical protein